MLLDNCVVMSKSSCKIILAIMARDFKPITHDFIYNLWSSRKVEIRV